MSALSQAIQSLTPTAEIELFELDTRSLGGSLLYFHAGTNQLGGSVVWGGQAYTPFPIQVTGFETSGSGSLPRPRMSVSNIDGIIRALVRGTNDMVGATVTRRRTLAMFLDAVNFPCGVNPTADSGQAMPPDVYVVDRKVQEDKEIIVFELASVLDMEDFQVPAAQVLPVCSWVYRSAECSYTGGACAKADDTPTADLAQDQCGGRVTSCKLRFGTYGVLPFGGFPGANALRGML